MNQLEAAFRAVFRDLKDLGARFALIGRMAVSLRAEERATRDIDLAVSTADDSEAEALVRALQARGYQLLEVLEQTAAGRLATVRLEPPLKESRAVIDLLFASSGLEPEVVSAAEELPVLPGIQAPVAGLAHLLALKVLAEDEFTRLRDRLDIFALLEEASTEDIAATVDLLKLIHERGFNRGKDLLERFSWLRAARDGRKLQP